MTTGKKRIRRLLNLLISGYLLLLFAWLALKVANSVNPPARAPVTVNLNELRSLLQDKYRLRPDKRILLAVADIHHILTGQPRLETECRFHKQRWLLFYADRAVGSLPEVPEFADGMDLLINWTAKLTGSRPSVREVSYPTGVEFDSDFWIVESFAVAGRADKLWQERQYRQALIEASRALTNLSFQCVDYLEVSDEIPARALAAVAILKTYALADTNRQECLLSESMGYNNHARRQAAYLPARDPVRLYVRKQDEELEKLAKTGGSQVCRFLYLKRLSERFDMDGWQSWEHEYFMDAPEATLSVLSTGLNIQSFEKQLTLSAFVIEVLPGLVGHKQAPALNDTVDMSYLESVRALLNGRLCREIAAAENAIEDDLLIDSGRFMDADSCRSYYRAFLDSAVYSIASHYLDKFPTGSGAQRFADCIRQDKDQDAPGLASWYQHLVAAENKGQAIWALSKDLHPASPLGPHANLRTLEEITRYVDYRDPSMFDAVKRLFSCMDTRPHHRNHAAAIAYKYLLDLELTKKLYEGAVTSGWDPNHIGPWYLVWTGNYKLLQESLKDPDLKLDRQLETLGLLTKKKRTENESIARETFALLWNRYPDSWPVAASYSDFLAESGDLDAAENVLRGWLSTNAGAAGWNYLQAITKLSGLYYKQGRFEDGLKCIQPLADSDLVDVQQQRALLLYDAGQKRQALKLARQVLQVHPRNIRALNLALRLSWRQGQYKEAAELIDSLNVKLGSSGYRAIAATFVDVFACSPEKAIAAIDAIAPLHTMSSLFFSTLTLVADTQGHHQLAFVIASHVPVAPEDRFNYLVASYDYLRKWKDKEVALGWLVEELAKFNTGKNRAGSKTSEGKERVSLGQSVHEFGQDDLLWKLFPRQLTGGGSDYIWLLRAAYALDEAPVASSYRADLINYYGQDQPGKVLGRFLLGMAPESKVESIANEKGEVCKSAYFLGLKAESKRDYKDATKWFRLAVETGYRDQVERTWAYERLLQYQYSEMTLDELSKKAG